MRASTYKAGIILFTSLISAVLMVSNQSYASSFKRLMFGVRGHYDSVEHFCKDHPGCKIINEESVEFSNGDTFVRVKTNLTGENVGILVPSHLTPQTLMETLIKIRTAKTLGARQITAYLETEPQSIEVEASNGPLNLPLESLLGVAGAQRVSVHGHSHRPIILEPKIAKRGLTHSFVLNDDHDSVAHAMASELNVPLYNLSNMPADLTKGAEIFLVKPVVIPKSETFFTALALIRKLTQEGAAVTWVTPLPWARSDKADQKGVTVIGRLVADLIESAGTESIAFARAHAPQSQGFFKIPSFNVLGLETLGGYLRQQGVEMIVSPDTGFQKDATLYADLLGLPVAVANKQRDPLTAKTKFYGFSGPSPEGKIAAIVDDETSTGGTLAEVADYLKQQGSKKVLAAVTHLAGDGGKALSSSSIDQMVVTDSYPVAEVHKSNPKLVVVPIGKELGRAVERLVVPTNSDACAEVVGGMK